MIIGFLEPSCIVRPQTLHIHKAALVGLNPLGVICAGLTFAESLKKRT